MGLERAPDRIGVRLVRLQTVSGPDPPDHEHAVVRLDLALDVRHQPSLIRPDAARFQRAPEGSGQSAAGRGDDIVEGRGDVAVVADAVVLGDR